MLRSNTGALASFPDNAHITSPIDFKLILKVNALPNLDIYNRGRFTAMIEHFDEQSSNPVLYLESLLEIPL